MREILDPATKQIPAGTPLAELPRNIKRRCCYGKTSCGMTSLHLHVEATLSDAGDIVHLFEYRRDSNNDVYYSAGTVEELIEQVNNTDRWPFLLVPETGSDAVELAADAARGHLNAYWGPARDRVDAAYREDAATAEETGDVWTVTPTDPELPAVTVSKTSGKAEAQPQ